MQGTVVMLLALSGLGCHHKKCETSYATTCYSSSYSDGCYSSCYSSTCYSSCYSSGYSSGQSSCYSGAAYAPTDYSCYSCYSSCYSTPRHKHGLFGHKRKHCSACAPAAPMLETASCDPCSSYGGPPVYGTYTPVYDGYASGQYIGSGQSSAPTMSSQATTPATKPVDVLPPPTPEAPSPGNPAPAPATPPTPAPGT